MSSPVPNYPPNYGSLMQYFSQTPPLSSTPTSDENVLRATEFPEFYNQIGLGGMSGASEPISDANANEPAQARRKIPKWTTNQNLVLLSGWIKYGTDSIVGRNQKSEAYWSKISEYCNEHCSFDPPRDRASCRNHFNYLNKKLSKWSGTYNNARRMQQSGWSENDVMTKAHKLYSSGKNEHFNLMSEWLAVRDQPSYSSQVGGNIGSTSSGSKRSRESDANDSNSVGSNSAGSSARPMGIETAKKKAKRKAKAQLWKPSMKSGMNTNNSKRKNWNDWTK
ncbi:PREDICTED: glutathione S-transferase T3-like [Brassica oleracea var. oleracea]|nr:PREDICTED: glutathione S-transferase T3-like [Brassica oleracea var. oleracea]